MPVQEVEHGKHGRINVMQKNKAVEACIYSLNWLKKLINDLIPSSLIYVDIHLCIILNCTESDQPPGLFLCTPPF